MNTLDQIAGKIIKEQERIIGPLAWEEAHKISGLHIIDEKAGVVSIDAQGDRRSVIDALVNIYEMFFGRASHEVCREAAAPFLAALTPTEIPLSLQ
jgi:hypothetical protein